MDRAMVPNEATCGEPQSECSSTTVNVCQVSDEAKCTRKVVTGPRVESVANVVQHVSEIRDAAGKSSCDWFEQVCDVMCGVTLGFDVQASTGYCMGHSAEATGWPGQIRSTALCKHLTDPVSSTQGKLQWSGHWPYQPAHPMIQVCCCLGRVVRKQQWELWIHSEALKGLTIRSSSKVCA